MIRKVRFSNFYSFYEEQEISFLTNKKNSYSYFTSKSGDQISKISGFIGSNASGKTNTMRFFSFLRYFVVENSKGNQEDSTDEPKINYKTFFNNKEPSKFYIEFELDNTIYFYSFEIKESSIKSEQLELRKLIKNSRKKTIFRRINNKVIQFNEEYLKGFSLEFLNNIRADTSLMAYLKFHYNIEIINTVYEYFKKFKSNLNEKGQINNRFHELKTIKLYLDDPEIMKQMESFVCRFDLGLSGFDIEKTKVDSGTHISIYGLHQSKNEDKKLHFSYESRGTRSLFFTLANILNSLKNNSVVIIDEMEAGLHPDALNKLLTYFIDENENKKAQLLFSSHSLGFLNKLDMQQIFLTEKNDFGASINYRLDEVDNIRPDENFFAKYMSGAYGAFPKIKI